MATEDKMLAIKARHACARTNLDISELIITSSRGMVELNGKVKARGKGGEGETSVPKEFRRMVDVVRAVPGVKDVLYERVRVLD